MEANKTKARKPARLLWQRTGTGRSKELMGTGVSPSVDGRPSSQVQGVRQGAVAGDPSRPVALHTHTYTYVFNRLTHHTHRVQLRRTFCEGLYGAPRAIPNSAFYTELDERLRLQSSTLMAVRNKLVVECLAAASNQEDGIDTVAMRQDVNSSLSRQMEFFTSCMERYCGPPRICRCNCESCGGICLEGGGGKDLSKPLAGPSLQPYG
ncbi:hypothetical protein VOLCADRAFT_108206 [Volvox carteri f. nagariensis]|uniref:Uncharacterized protein n=1 Tax=Volvox carteri f. nagariensis TaxID=3068 RepID=D8UIW4_VOLCA|nr:uncharacterized protein VOLCADRAFT_108206 [Volvox carteri f. nagariensis]EFJ40326.1 hypothetical protein VOLCADRAFT_108206 [Volvox carteri f. nagariensis]|eukprot:XP_002958589.1 hypothetical protein VOLCADRAFT_108206 [Volvox carteri f. nagariensis]